MDDRRRSILELREAGLSFRHIGEKLGVSSSRAAVLHKAACRLRNRYCSLSVKASNRLHEWGLWPDGVKEPDKAAITAFVEKEGSNIYGYEWVGPALVREICDWAGIDMPPQPGA